MKKLFVTSLFLVGIANLSAFADIPEPQWTEFCPPQYCDANDLQSDEASAYWYNRRVQFEKSLANCSKYFENNMDYCYDEIRATEMKKNQVREIRQSQSYKAYDYNKKLKNDAVNRSVENAKRINFQ